MPGEIPTVLGAIGNTPLVRLQRLATARDATLCAKWERTNPAGSVKDRPARFIVEAAERAGYLRPGGVIIESSSGNFGISLAMIGAARGYRVLILVDPKTTQANLATLAAYGAEVVVVTEKDDTGSYHKTRIARANELAREIPDAFRPDQCFNLLNREAHDHTTAAEILAACADRLDVVVAAVSTGGQLGGLARHFKRHMPAVRVVGVDAVGSAIFGGASHEYLTPGVGLGWTPDNLDLALLDAAFKLPDEDAFLACRALARSEGILAGASGGAALLVGLHYAQSLGPDARVVCVLADGGERYLHTVYSDEWMRAHGLPVACTVDELRARARALRPLPGVPGAGGTRIAGISGALSVPSSTREINAQVARGASALCDHGECPSCAALRARDKAF